MKKLVVLLLIICVVGSVYAQQAENKSITDPNPATVGADSAIQSLREISVDMFEREGSWNARISPDAGVISAKLFDGGPNAKEPISDPENTETEDSKVLGVKVEFFQRGINTFYITSARPLPIEGVTKTVSFWVAGRNQGHSLYLLIQDYFGNNFELYVGSLAFSGWKKMAVAIPPSPDGKRGIIQNSPFYGNKPGLRIVGLKVECDPEYARGSYYLYLDDMRAVTDLYSVENRDIDDISDTW